MDDNIKKRFNEIIDGIIVYKDDLKKKKQDYSVSDFGSGKVISNTVKKAKLKDYDSRIKNVKIDIVATISNNIRKTETLTKSEVNIHAVKDLARSLPREVMSEIGPVLDTLMGNMRKEKDKYYNETKKIIDKNKNQMSLAKETKTSLPLSANFTTKVNNEYIGVSLNDMLDKISKEQSEYVKTEVKKKNDKVITNDEAQSRSKIGNKEIDQKITDYDKYMDERKVELKEFEKENDLSDKAINTKYEELKKKIEVEKKLIPKIKAEIEKSRVDTIKVKGLEILLEDVENLIKTELGSSGLDKIKITIAEKLSKARERLIKEEKKVEKVSKPLGINLKAYETKRYNVRREKENKQREKIKAEKDREVRDEKQVDIKVANENISKFEQTMKEGVLNYDAEVKQGSGEITDKQWEGSIRNNGIDATPENRYKQDGEEAR